MTGAGPSEDDVALAGEYVLNLLDADERRAFERRLASEPDLRALVVEWEEGLVPMADTVAPVTPPRRAKAAIESRLFGAAPRRARWPRWLAGGVAVAAVALLAFFVLPVLRQDAFTPELQAAISAEAQDLLVSVSVSTDTADARIERPSGGPAEGRDLELWLIAEGADAPVSLGVLPPAREATVPLPPERVAQMRAGAVLAISDEPAGGSPTGAPTGPVLGTAALAAL